MLFKMSRRCIGLAKTLYSLFIMCYTSTVKMISPRLGILLWQKLCQNVETFSEISQQCFKCSVFEDLPLFSQRWIADSASLLQVQILQLSSTPFHVYVKLLPYALCSLCTLALMHCPLMKSPLSLVQAEHSWLSLPFCTGEVLQSLNHPYGPC